MSAELLAKVLKAKLAIAVEALEFYANKEIWFKNTINGIQTFAFRQLFVDLGDTAIDALKAIAEMDGER